MKLPYWLWIVIICLLLLGIGDFTMSFFFERSPMGNVSNLALMLTLVGLLFYVYYTYVLAKDTMTPSASFSLKPHRNDSLHFLFIIQNYSRLSLQCWCNLSVTIHGNPISLEGFYGGQSSFDVQPFGTVNSHFNLRDYIREAGETVEKLVYTTRPENLQSQLRMNIDFWYAAVGSGVIIRNPRQPYYFDFIRKEIVLDF
jgi:hypothetical protein